MRPDQPLIAILTDEYAGYPKVFVDRIAAVMQQSGYAALCIAGKGLSPQTSRMQTSALESLLPLSCGSSICNNIYDLAQKFNLQGLISLSGNLGLRIAPAELEMFLNQFDVPKVSLGIGLASIPSVVVDDSTAMYQLMEHLTTDRRRLKYAFVRGFPNDTYSMQREGIYREVLQRRGIEILEDCFIEGNYDAFDAYHAVTQLLGQHPDLDVIVAANDTMALSAARAIKATGLLIPSDIVVTGFDDTEEATQNSPALTTVRQPLAEMADCSARLLLKLLQPGIYGSEVGVQQTGEIVVTVNSELVVRASTLSDFSPLDSDNVAVGDSLCARLEFSMSGLPAPSNFDFSEVAIALQETMDTGSSAFEMCVEKFQEQQSDTRQRHWWSNLWHQIEVLSVETLEQGSNVDRLPLILVVLAKVREQIWSASLGHEFDVHRQQSLRSDMQLQMSSCTQMQDILDVHSRWLKTLRARRCFLVKFDEPSIAPRQHASLMHAYAFSNPEPEDSVGRSASSFFPSQDILPERYIAELAKGLLILHPLYAGDSLFGYTLVDPTGLNNLQIDDIAQSIGNAMRNNHLINQLELQASSLRSVNRDLGKLANFDHLTELPNRRQFQQQLSGRCLSHHGSQNKFHVMFMDLDGFKQINDTLGHDSGDDLLVLVAERLRGLAERVDVGSLYISRLGGDEFTLIFEPLSDGVNVGEFTERLLFTVSQPYQLRDLQVAVSASIGCASFPFDGKTSETLVKHADTAMYRAKHLGKNRVAYFTPELASDSSRLWELDQEMRVAIGNGDICMYYQPRIDMASGEICAVEALMRWQNRTEAGIQTKSAPNEFIPIAESTGFILQLDDLALEASCALIREWELAGTPLRVAVNVSVMQLQKERFVQHIKDTLSKYKIDPTLLELEITESGIMTQVEQNVKKLASLSDMGVQLSIDDFGTGYSSMNYLKQLPVNNLKIDRSFVSGIERSDGGNTADAAIIRSILALGKSMDFRLIAEGVETEAQKDYIKSLGCDEAQGYLFSKPVSRSETCGLVKALYASESAA